MNILILSSGTRNKVVQYFKKALAGSGRVICTDMSSLAPSLYEADKFYTVPRMTAPGYIDVILDICKKEAIGGVLSLIDPELSLLAENKDKFLLPRAPAHGAGAVPPRRTQKRPGTTKCRAGDAAGRIRSGQFSGPRPRPARDGLHAGRSGCAGSPR